MSIKVEHKKLTDRSKAKLPPREEVPTLEQLKLIRQIVRKKLPNEPGRRK